MQLANCRVRLGGDMTNEVLKQSVTPAEVAVLRLIHGDDSVLKVEPFKQDKRPHAQEFERLLAEYGQKVVEAAFPGVAPQLPVSFKDIGINVYAEEKPTRARGGGTAGTDNSSPEGGTDGANAPQE